MTIRLIQVPYDSGHRAQRMGCGPLHLIASHAPAQLGRFAPVSVATVETSASFPTEIGSAFDLHRTVATVVSDALNDGAIPLVLSGNCNASLGTVAGIQSAQSGKPLGVLWFDGHASWTLSDGAGISSAG